VVSLGFDADGKRIRKMVSGQTRTEVKDKLKALHSELDAGIRSTAAYTVEKAVVDWLAEGLPGRTAKTVEVNRDSLRPLLAVIGTIPLRDLTVQDVRTALKKMAATHATRTLQKAHWTTPGSKAPTPAGWTTRTTARSFRRLDFGNSPAPGEDGPGRCRRPDTLGRSGWSTGQVRRRRWI
jgi:hypothetical protein